MVMAAFNKSIPLLSLASVALLALSAIRALASQESVDDLTKMALLLDAHPGHGKALFHQYCIGCHGTGARGDASRIVPALAGQRFSYLIRQLVNFS